MKQAVLAPAALLDQLGITTPSEIVIEGIAEHCGATILYEPLDGCEARILGVGERAIITVNANASRPRQRFSAAHELGHWMYDRGKVAFACTADNLVRGWADNDPELRANRYAANILLPRSLFESAARGLPATFESVRRIATTFETSLTATAIRLVEVGDAPAMIVCNEAGGRCWFFRSPLVQLWPRSKPGRNTDAARLLAGGFTRAGGPTTVDADEWIDHSDASKYTLVEDSMKAGDVVLSLLWWKDERQILDLDNDDDADAASLLSGRLSFPSRRGR